MPITKKSKFKLAIPPGPTSVDWHVEIFRVEQNGNVGYQVKVICGAETVSRTLDPLRFCKLMQLAAMTPEEYLG